MKKWIFLLAPLMFLSACGDDWNVGDANKADRFNRRFRYYYAETCRYDSFGPYDCKGIQSLDRSMSVSLLIEWDGYAVLTLDGNKYRYYERDYSQGYDGISDYYQFYENDGSVTIYTDGTEMIYVDNYAGEAIYYYSSLY